MCIDDLENTTNSQSSGCVEEGAGITPYFGWRVERGLAPAFEPLRTVVRCSPVSSVSRSHVHSFWFSILIFL